MLCQTTIERFRKVLNEELGHDATEKEASDMLNTLVRFFNALAQYDYADKKPHD